MSRLRKIALFGSLALAANAYAVGLIPTPVLKNAQISADVSFDPGSGKYTYAYTVTNPAGNTGEIWNFRIDVTADRSTNGMVGNTFGLTIPLGTNRVDFSSLLSRLVVLNNAVSTPTLLQAQTIVPFGQSVPPGWNGGLGIGGFANFSSGDNTPSILPGSNLGGFQLLSFGVPTIRNVHIIPFWMHVVEDHDAVTEADVQAAGQIEQSIIFKTVTLGVSGVGHGSFAHWNQLRDDLARAIKLGWIIDPVLAINLTNQLAFARQALDMPDFFTARNRLQPLLATINQSTSAQRTSEGFGLVSLNVRSLIDNTPDNRIEPKVTLTPKSASLSIGSRQTLSLTVIDLANGSRPLAGIPVNFRVTSGPNAGNLGNTQTDAQGKATVTYLGKRVGTDRIIATAFGGEITFDDAGLVVWSGGPDLVVPLFIPPLLKTAGGRTFFVTEETQNIGNVATPLPSVTRYFISSDQKFSPATTQIVGERAIPALQPDEFSSVKLQALTIPSNLPEGTYFLAACADANNVIVELDKTNNCSFTKIQGRQSIVVPVEFVNRPPDCSKAAPSIATLWPPNHKLVTVAVLGVTDPDGDPVSILITGITQDEPVNGLGDGNTCPDGFGVGTSQAQLRAERSGLGNGRVYAVSFTASDGKGGTCTSKVNVGVPHDQGRGRIPIDDGQKFDSTKC